MRERLLGGIARLITNHPWKILAAALILTAVSIIYSATSLQLHTDQDDLVSEDQEYHKRYKDYLREFGDLEYLYVVIEIEDNLDEAKKFARSLAGRLEKLSDIKEVTYQINNPVLEKSFLLYLTKPQLEGLKSFLSTGPTSVKNLAQWNGVDNILGGINNLMEKPDPESAQEEMRSGFRFLSELIDGLESTLKTGKVYKPNLATAFLGGDESFDEDGFLLTPNGKLMFVLIMPMKQYDTLSVIEEPLRKIRNAIQETRDEYPEISAGLTGRPVLQADEMSVTNKDMTRATILAILAATLLFILYFKRLTRPIMAMVCLLFGISWTFGLTTLFIGYLNLLSTVFAVILVGAGIEFGLQIVSRYREELEAHKDPKLAVKTCVTKTGYGNITAALTTSAAFFTALLTEFAALTELGFIAGCGILLCLTSLLVVLPTMMFLRDRHRPKKELKTELLINLKGIDVIYKRPKLIIIILAIVTIAGLPGLAKLKFDHNLLNLQADGLESVDFEKKIINKSDESTWYAISITRTPLEAAKIAKQMKQKDTVGKVEGYERIVPENQEEKIKIVKELKKAFKGIDYKHVKEEIDMNRLTYNLKIMIRNLERLTEMAFSSGYVDAVEELDTLNEKVQNIYNLLLKADDEAIEKLIEFQQTFVEKFRKGLKILESGLEPEKITINDLPESIRNRYVGKTGKIATYIYPKFNIWEPDKMKDFVSDLRTEDADVTGTPIEVYESSKLMQESFQKAALYALLVILILVMIDFKVPRYSFLSLVPLFLGILWLLELMGWTGIPFNLANFFAIPILLGVGVDNGVQIVHRYLQGGRNTKVMSTSTGAAVLLTSLTTGISFGMLILSAHRGIQSLGLIMALGASTCLVGSMILLPAILKVLKK